MTPISGLASGAPAQNTDAFLIARGGSNYRLALSDIISAEATARAAADLINTNAISAEAVTRGNADTTLTNNLLAETAARIAADAGKLATSYLDTDITLAANSDVKIPSQKAIKAYVDALVVAANETTSGILEVATNAETIAGTLDTKIITPLKLATNLPIGIDSGTASLILKGGTNTNSGDYSVALGANLSMSGNYAASFGQGISVSGNHSFGGGMYDISVSGTGAFAWHYNAGGYGPIPISYVGNYSVLLGGTNCTVGVASSAAVVCSNTTISGANIVALGRDTETLSQTNTCFTRTLNIKGGVQHKVNSITTNATLTYADDITYVDPTAGNITITLPASPIAGQDFSFWRTVAGANTITIDGNGKNINGAGTYTGMVAQYSKVRIIYDGSQWFY